MHDLPPYEDRSALLHLVTLAKRRSIACVMFIFDVLSGRVNSPNLLSVLDLITPPYLTRGTELLRIDFHRTNYGLHETIVGCDATVSWGHWSFWFRSDPESVFESPEADFAGLFNSSPIIREHCTLPYYCALSFSTVNMLSERFYSPHQLIFVKRLSRYFLIFFSFVFYVFFKWKIKIVS
jgi:hypothetical protein